jgi:hypothetical protein
VKFYIFINRHVIIKLDDTDQLIIKVLRIFCHLNYELKKQQPELQYTITVLPGFLISHSRILSYHAFNAVDQYIKGKVRNQYEGAILINCNSRHTFRLYYTRIVQKLDTWLIKTVPRKTDIDVYRNKSDYEKWRTVSNCWKDWTPPHLSEEWQCYGHATLCFMQMGLGP